MKWLATRLWLVGVAASQVSASSYLVPITVSCLCLAGFLALLVRYLSEQQSVARWSSMAMALLALIVLADDLRRFGLVHLCRQDDGQPRSGAR